MLQVPVNDVYTGQYNIMSQGCIQTDIVKNNRREPDALFVSDVSTSTECMQEVDTIQHTEDVAVHGTLVVSDVSTSIECMQEMDTTQHTMIWCCTR